MRRGIRHAILALAPLERMRAPPSWVLLAPHLVSLGHLICAPRMRERPKRVRQVGPGARAKLVNPFWLPSTQATGHGTNPGSH